MLAYAPPSEILTLSLHDALPIFDSKRGDLNASLEGLDEDIAEKVTELQELQEQLPGAQQAVEDAEARVAAAQEEDRKSTRLNSSHVAISYAVFCLKKKNIQKVKK